MFAAFHQAQHVGDGRLLASCLAPVNTLEDPYHLQSFAQLSNYQAIAADVRYHIIQDRNATKLPKAEANGWVDILVAFWKCTKELVVLESGQSGGSWSKAFDSYKEVCMQLIRGYTNNGFQSWTVPCLYTTGKYLRMIAMKADAESQSSSANGDLYANGFSDDIMGNSNKNEKLEAAAWVLNRMFTICLSDRSELSESRKWGIYSTTNLLFKTYFRLSSISLTKNVLRALAAAEGDLPPLELFPKSHRCTFKYYRGVLDFLQENYSEAETNLAEALALCHHSALKNREQILIYLIPTHMLLHHKLPSSALLAPHRNLSNLFAPLCTAIKCGSLSSFDDALSNAEPELVADVSTSL